MFVKGKSKTIQANKGYQSVTVEMAGNDIRFLYIGDNFVAFTPEEWETFKEIVNEA